ncbi:hypothetical protein C0Z18_23855 [Trinickia dabaoshanensis]|uniref:Uncharacterized protein n=1 Tax=Trinickia dabaoshanensis TaxID=564714 RepID=A0A2N7VGR3_9BURK|nr:hypothetical protein C0Z18_23855 [Trinickia dabaoshanensis]
MQEAFPLSTSRAKVLGERRRAAAEIRNAGKIEEITGRRDRTEPPFIGLALIRSDDSSHFFYDGCQDGPREPNDISHRAAVSSWMLECIAEA